MTLKNDLVLLLKPYYFINILLSLSYILAKKVPYVCELAFPDANPTCEIDTRESEILFFLLIVVMIRTKKSGSVTMINYLTSSFIYNKVANLVLWFYADPRMGIMYAVAFVLLGLIFPEPTYSGPENVVYFRTGTALEDELVNDKRITWLIEFYTAWNPACANFAPTFARLSTSYGLENLKFGKIDIGRYPDAAKKFRVDEGAMSSQLPTVILFRDGKEETRRPAVDNKGKVIKFFFSEDNMKASFDLNNIYNACKSTLVKKKGVEEKHVKSE